jgi:hypothetical protein
MRRERYAFCALFVPHPLRGGLTSGRTYGAEDLYPVLQHWASLCRAPTKESGCIHRTYGAEDLYPVLLHWARFVSRPDQGVGMHTPRAYGACAGDPPSNGEEFQI